MIVSVALPLSGVDRHMPVPFPQPTGCRLCNGRRGTIFIGMSMPAPDPLCRFHPAVAGWFSAAFRPTPAQAAAWPLVRAGRSTLVAAPTGSGKTLTAFRRHRRAGAAGPDRGRAGRRHPGALRVAAQGAVQRYPYQPRTTAGRHRRRAATARPAAGGHSHRCAHRRRRRPSATRCASGCRISWSPRRNRSTCCSAPSPGGRCCAMCAA